MNEMERQAQMALGNLQEMDRIPIGAEFDWLQPQTARGATFVYQAFFSDHWPGDFVKHQIRQCKIELLMRVLDEGHHGYSWLFRFDERWEPLRGWELSSFRISGNPDRERHKKLTLRAELTKYSSYDDIIPYRNKRPILWKPLSNYETRDLIGELRRRIAPAIRERFHKIRRPLKIAIMVRYWRLKVLAVDNRRRFKVWRESKWNGFWRIK